MGDVCGLTSFIITHCTCREALENEGNMIMGLTIEQIKGSHFRAFVAGPNGSKKDINWHRFTKKKKISILMDLAVRTGRWQRTLDWCLCGQTCDVHPVF